MDAETDKDTVETEVEEEPRIQHTASMVELKAELARKQREADELRARRDEGEEARRARLKIVKKRKLPSGTAGGEERSAAASSSKSGSEDEEDAVKSGAYRKKLEVKARLYESLSRDRTTIGDELLAASTLVDFERKNLDEMRRSDGWEDKERDGRRQDDFDDDDEVEVTSSEHPGEGWVEYQDAAGRRKFCFESDLPFMKAREERRGAPALGRSWQDPREKEGPVHYQDVLQDEVREHGVGYYAFSTDEDTRRRQQEDMEARGRATKAARARAGDAAAVKRRALAERLKKVRQRRRLRAGLPLLPEDEDDDGDGDGDNDKGEGDGKEAKVPADEQQQRGDDGKEEEEPEVEGIPAPAPSKPAVRPWDLGKIGVHVGPEYTEKCWLREQRDDRVPDFAPPSSYEGGSAGRRTSSRGRSTAKTANNRSLADEPAVASAAAAAAPPSDRAAGFAGSSRCPPFQPPPRRPDSTSTLMAAEQTGCRGANTRGYRRDNDGDEDDDEIGPPPPPREVRNPEFAPPATLDYNRGAVGRKAAATSSQVRRQDVAAALAYAKLKWQQEHPDA